MKTICLFAPSLSGTASWTADRDYMIERVNLVGNAILSKDSTSAVPLTQGVLQPEFLSICVYPSNATPPPVMTLEVKVPVLKGESVYLIPIASSNAKSAVLVLTDPSEGSIEPDG